MARKHKAPPPKASPTLFGIGFKAALTVFIGIGLLTMLVWIGQRAGNAVADQPRYQIPITEVQCNTPAGMDRTIFLNEVRAVGNLPETVSAVAVETPPLLATAFAKHPWVASVDRVSVKSDRTIHVELVFRTPVLAVKIAGETKLRMVDKTGTLLPTGPIPDQLAKLTIEVKAVDATVKRAAEICENLRERKPRTIEKIATGWRVTPESGQALLLDR